MSAMGWIGLGRMAFAGVSLGMLVLATGAGAAESPTRVGDVSTTFRVLGKNDKIVVDRYDDPKVDGVSCYVSRAETGGIKGSVGLATDPSRVQHRVPGDRESECAKRSAGQRGGVRSIGELAVQGGSGEPDLGSGQACPSVSGVVDQGVIAGRQPV